jgi:hypothetical protein
MFVLVVGGAAACTTDLPALRARIERAKAAPGQYDDDKKGYVGGLTGMSADQIAAALGKPSWCRDPAKIPPPTLPCDTTERVLWAYPFFHLPPMTEGGGTELWLELSGGVCVGAEWGGSE